MNAVNLVGRLVADPELKNSQKGRSYCRMRIAVTGRRSKGDSNPEALYVDVTTFGGEAEACARHLSQGSKVAVSGRLSYREWTGKDGSKRSAYSVVGSVDFLEPIEKPELVVVGGGRSEGERIASAQGEQSQSFEF